jgi:hypothetical protein
VKNVEITKKGIGRRGNEKELLKVRECSQVVGGERKNQAQVDVGGGVR